MDLKDALRSVAGKSPLADVIIERRFGDMVSESSVEPSADSLTELQRDAILDAVTKAEYDKSGDSAVRELTSVILHLLDELALAHEERPSEGETYDEEEAADKIAVFRESLIGARVGDLKLYYTDRVFKEMKRSTRVLVAKELVDHAEAQGKEPARTWSVLVQNNGNM